MRTSLEHRTPPAATLLVRGACAEGERTAGGCAEGAVLPAVQPDRPAAASPGSGSAGTWAAEEVRCLRERLRQAEATIELLGRESEERLHRCQGAERELQSLLGLYVAGYQLHAAFDEESLFGAIKEIVLNLVGADIFTLWLVDQASGELVPATILEEQPFFKGSPPPLPRRAIADLAAGLTWQGSNRTCGTPDEPLACFPLRIGERTVGALAIHKLLVQKEGLSAGDHEMFDLLAKQAASALLGARSFRESGKILRHLETGARATNDTRGE